MASVTPRNVRYSHFFRSALGNADLEMFLHYFVNTQFMMSPDWWTPFTLKEYETKCAFEYIDPQHHILDAMVYGGDVFCGEKNIRIDAGYFKREGDKYIVTEQLLEVMRPYAHLEA